MSYAADTAVPISRTRVEIDQLLRTWKADMIQWTDEFSLDRVTLRFVWTHEKHAYKARFTIVLPASDQVRKAARHKTTGQVIESRFRKLMDARGQQEHRILLLWLKAAFNAVTAKIVTPEVIFMPFFEGPDGRTVAEIMVPQLDKLADAKLLPAPR